MSRMHPVLAATGLCAEARIAAGSGVVAVAGGGDPARLALLLQSALRRGARAVMSFGIAGGLEPTLKPGTVIIGRTVVDADAVLTADPGWIERLARLLPGAAIGSLAGTDTIVGGIDGKRALHATTGALAVDMESHIAARLAARHGLPFAVLRVVADPAGRTVPHAATVGMRADGTTDGGAVLRALSRRPGDLPALIRTALDARAAFAALRRCRASLSPELGFDPSALTLETSWGREPASAAALFGLETSEVQVENG